MSKMSKQPGRPRLPKGERVADRERLTMYVAEKEAIAIRKMANKAGLSIGNYMHRVIFGGKFSEKGKQNE